MKEIFIVTHTQATHHVDRLVGGWYDSNLTEKGVTDARACGRRLLEIGLGDVAIFSSDLARARETAEVIAEHLGSSIQYDARLREMSFGTAEGRSVKEVGAAIPSHEGNNRLDYRNRFGGETKRELASRLYDVMEEIGSRERAIVCTHGFATTFLIACWIGMPIESAGYVNFRVRPGSITSLVEDNVYANRAVRYLSDMSHLDS